jgi:PAS domain S-box-containing protein
MMFDRQGRCLKTNRTGLTLMGFKEGELLSRNFIEIWPEDSRPIVDTAITKVLKGAQTRFEADFINPGGARMFWSVRLDAVHDKDGGISGFVAISTDITAHKKTEEELKRHREHLQTLVDDRTSKLMLFSRAVEEAMDGIQIIDLNGYILYSNKAAEEIYGYAADELAGTPIYELNADVEFGKMVVLPSIEETGRWTGEIIVHHKDGHQFPVWLSLSMVKYENGDPAAMVGIIRDMTERKKAGDALRRSEENFRTLFDSAADAIFILDMNGKFIDANRSAYERLGYRKEDMLAMHVSQLEPPEYGAKTAERIEQHKKYGHVVFESVHLKNDGTAIPVEVDSSIIDFDGEKVFFSINRDITERKRYEQQIQLAYAELDQIFNTAVDGMIVISRDFSILRVNETLLSLLGWQHNEILGKKCHEIFASADLCHTASCPLKKIMGGETHVEFETGKTRRDGVNIPCLITAAPFKNPDGDIIGIVEDIRDITERKKVEENTLKTRKLESIGLLAGGIAHDFNNLLSAIIGDIGIAKKLVPPGNLAVGRLDDAEQICAMASDLSGRLIAFATGGDPVKSMVQLPEMIIDTVDATLGGSNINIEFDLPGDLNDVALDEDQMKQVIDHLTINAKEAMPDGGTFTVRGENIRISPQDSSPMRAGRYVKISFSDTGIGIPSENLAKIFDPYFSTKDTYNQKGLGLGLAVCYSVIKKHDGLITVESEVGKGTTCNMYLPAAAAA